MKNIAEVPFTVSDITSSCHFNSVRWILKEKVTMKLYVCVAHFGYRFQKNISFTSLFEEEAVACLSLYRET